MKHSFTDQIEQILTSAFGELWEEIYDKSPLIQYLNIKTKSANRGSKARGSFANIYAVYVLVEDYLANGFDARDDYSDYDGAKFTDLLLRQRELPFGRKLQNHALNSRLNEEFKRYFPQIDAIPILRNSQTNRYWINEHLLKIVIGRNIYQTAHSILNIIEHYIEAKQGAFEEFIKTCQRLQTITTDTNSKAQEFIEGLLAPSVDARIFEIVSYAILKLHYHEQTIYFGDDLLTIRLEQLKLYKTGRTNANDGGIDFVMRPLGRFFQVTETVDVRKYFLDIDKIEHYPISFVIKSEESIEELKKKLSADAEKRYAIKAIVEKYMGCIEEIINLVILREHFQKSIEQGHLKNILDEIIHQSRVEFHYNEA